MWQSHLTPGMELTGDTDNSEAFDRLAKVSLVVTTPEKWDSITRRTSVNRVLDRLRLMMIDEVGYLTDFNDGTLNEPSHLMFYSCGTRS